MGNGLRLRRNGYISWEYSFIGTSINSSKNRGFYIEYSIIKKDESYYGKIRGGSWGIGKYEINNYYNEEEIFVKNKDFEVIMGDSFLTNEALKGKLYYTKKNSKSDRKYSSSIRDMEWDLKLNDKLKLYNSTKMNNIFGNLKFNSACRKYEGKVKFNGEEYIVNSNESHGFENKKWGRNFSKFLFLISCNTFNSKIAKSDVTNTYLFVLGRGNSNSKHKNIKVMFYYKGELYKFKSNIRNSDNIIYKINDKNGYINFNLWAEKKTKKIEIGFKCNKNTFLKINSLDFELGVSSGDILSSGLSIGGIKFYEKVGYEWYLIEYLVGRYGKYEYRECVL